MKLFHETLENNIDLLIIRGIDIDDTISAENLMKIIKKLTEGGEFFFQFSREDFFLEEYEAVKYREEVPKFISKTGRYEVIYRRDDERFESIVFLPVNEKVYSYLPSIWRYFETVTFFSPKQHIDWQEFGKLFLDKKLKVSGVDFIKYKYADSVFIKGHDGDNLIFAYSGNYSKERIRETTSYFKNF